VYGLGTSKDWAATGRTGGFGGLVGDGVKRGEPCPPQFGPKLVECSFSSLEDVECFLLDHCEFVSRLFQEPSPVPEWLQRPAHLM